MYHPFVRIGFVFFFYSDFMVSPCIMSVNVLIVCCFGNRLYIIVCIKITVFNFSICFTVSQLVITI